MTTDNLRGDLAAIEYLLGQLFVYTVQSDPDPQGWIRKNIADISNKLGLRTGFTDAEGGGAEETMFRVMRTASRSLETDGHGPSIG